MNEYVFFTDSSCDLSQSMIDDLKINVIPMSFRLDGKDYKDYKDFREMPIDDFYTQLKSGSMATTAQLSPMDFEEIFEPYLKEGKDVFFMSFSSGLSGSCASAELCAKNLAEKYPENRIVVADTLSASMGQGLLVYLAYKQMKSGLDIDKLKDWVIKNRLSICHWFTVDDLNHLHRGGRVSKAAAVFGSALGIKPVLHVDNEGHLINMSKVRGRKNSLDALVDKMAETAIDPKEQVIFISHGGSEEDAKYVAKQVKEKFKVKEIYINPIGPVIGTHSGPGTMALFFIGTER